MAKLVLLAGAGASRALGPGFPTTLEFFSQLPRGVTAQPLYRLATDHIRTAKKADVVDVEELLWTLSALEVATAAATDSATPLGWLIGTGRIEEIQPYGLPVAAFGQQLGNARHVAERLRREIEEQVFALYGAHPPEDTLRVTWVRLLQELKQRDWSLELFTTNYDLCLELSLRRFDSDGFLETGRSGGLHPELELSRWQKGRPFSGPGLLTKLHGSVDWTRRGDAINTGLAGRVGVQDDRAIIYPGFKGVPQEEPFATLHSYFLESLRDCDCFAAIGFAFRDASLNEALATRLPESARVLLLDPAPPSVGCPVKPGRLVHTARRFEEGIEEFLATV